VIDSINTKKYRSNNFCIVFFRQSLRQVNHTTKLYTRLGQNLKNQKSGEALKFMLFTVCFTFSDSVKKVYNAWKISWAQIMMTFMIQYFLAQMVLSPLNTDFLIDFAVKNKIVRRNKTGMCTLLNVLFRYEILTFMSTYSCEIW
jgi:hypothetical protein